MLTKSFLISAIIVGCGLSIPASATLTECTTTVCFASASSGDMFSNISFAQGNLGTVTTDDGVVFSTNGAGFTGTTSPAGWPQGTTDTALVSSAGINTVTITLPMAVNAIEFYVGMQDYSYFTISVTDSNGGHFTDGSFEQTNLMVPKFVGVTTDGSFTTFTITSQGSPDTITLDAMQTGDQPPQTPEVATLLLVATGLFLMRYGRRWMPANNRPTQPASLGTVRTMSTGITPA